MRTRETRRIRNRKHNDNQKYLLRGPFHAFLNPIESSSRARMLARVESSIICHGRSSLSGIEVSNGAAASAAAIVPLSSLFRQRHRDRLKFFFKSIISTKLVRAIDCMIVRIYCYSN